MNRNRVIESPEEQAAKILYPVLLGKERAQIEEQIALLRFEEIKALIEEARNQLHRHEFSISRFNLVNTLKAAIYEEETRRRLASDILLNSEYSGIPKAVKVHPRRISAEKNARLFSDRTIEREVEELMKHKRDTMTFEERETEELGKRGMDYRLSYFLTQGFDFKDAGGDLILQWDNFAWELIQDFRYDFLQYKNNLLSTPAIPPEDIIDLGSYSVSDIEAALKELKPFCIEYNDSLSQSLKKPHLLHLDTSTGILKFTAGSGEDAQSRSVISQTQYPSLAKTHSTIALEQISQVLAIREQELSPKRSKGRPVSIDILEREDGALIGAKSAYKVEMTHKDIKGDYKVQLALDLGEKRLIMNGGRWEVRLKLYLCERTNNP